MRKFGSIIGMFLAANMLITSVMGQPVMAEEPGSIGSISGSIERDYLQQEGDLLEAEEINEDPVAETFAITPEEGGETGNLGFETGTYTLSADGKTLTLDGTGAKDKTLSLYFLYTDRMLDEKVFDPTNVTSVTIKNYETIDSEAFSWGSHQHNWDNLKNVTICSGVKTIGGAAFSHLNIENVTIQEGVETIGMAAFCYTKLKEVTLPSTVREIGFISFTDCTELETINLNEGLETIGQKAFEYCPKIKDMVIPDTVTSNNDLGFGWIEEELDGTIYHESLETLTLPISAIPTSPYPLDESRIQYDEIRIPGNTFKKLTFTKGNGQWPANRDDRDDNQLVAKSRREDDAGIPYEVVFGEGIASIPRNAFQWDELLNKVTVASTVTHIGAEAFEECQALKELTLVKGSGNRKLYIERDAFRNTNNLKTIDFPEDVKEIHTYGDAFKSWGYDAKTDKSIPEGIMDAYFRHPEVLIYHWSPKSENEYYLTMPSDFSEGCTMHAYPYDSFKMDYKNQCYSVKKMVEDNNRYYKQAYGKECYHFKSLGSSPKPSPTPTNKTVKISGLTLSSEAVVKYADEVKSGTRVILTATLSPANVTDPAITFGVKDGSDPITGVITRSSVYDEERGEYSIFIDLVENVTGTAVVYVRTKDSNSTSQYEAECTVTIKDRETACTPYAACISGSENENGSLIALYSQTPGAQIFCSKDADKMNSVDTYVKWDDEAGRFVSSSDAVAEYTSPLVLGKDITNEANTIYAVAFKKDIKHSSLFAKTYTLPGPESVWGDITEEDRASEFDNNTDNLMDENGLKKKYSGIWAPGSQLKDASLTYTGNAVTIPGLRIYFGTALLSEDDHTLKYSNNVNPGDSAKINVTLKGKYSGKDTIYFTIGKCPVDKAGLSYSIVQVNAKLSGGVFAAQKPDPKVLVETTGKVLKSGTDVKITYKKNGTDAYGEAVTEPGVYSVRLENVNGSQYIFPAGDDAIVLNDAVYCVGGEMIAMNKASVSKIVTQDITKWDGAVEPSFTVTYNKHDLVGKKEGQDGSAHYSYRFVDNTQTGTATLYIIGTNETLEGMTFSGFVTAKFKISGIEFNNSNIKVEGINSEYSYTGSAVRPSYVLKYGNEVLTEGVDYTVSYAKNANTNVGKVDMVFAAKGRFSGVLKQSFKIVQKDAGDFCFTDGSRTDDKWNAWKDADQKYLYVKNGVTPKLRVYTSDESDKALVAGKDYVVKYNNNKAVGAYDSQKSGKRNGPNLTVTFKGNYKGSRTLYFNIDRPVFNSGYHMYLTDLVVNKAPNKFAQKPVVTDPYGTVLKAGTDYDKNPVYKYDEDVEVSYVTGRGIAKRTVTAYRSKGQAVSPSDIIPAGAVIRVTVNGTGNYEGEISETFSIMPNSIKDLKFSIDPKKSFKYTGRPVTPQKSDIIVQKKCGGKWVEAGSEVLDFYDITAYSNNIKTGNASLTVRGKNGYAGTTAVKFKILP